MESADVVIIGGGISGLTVSSILCSESNLDVVLIDMKEPGSTKTTPVVFPDTISSAGLEDCLYNHYDSFVLHSPLGAETRFTYQCNALASLNYQLTCKTLFERASHEGLQLCKAKAIRWSPPSPQPTAPLLIHLNTGEVIKAQILIDASGAGQWAARQLHIQLSPYYSICYGELLTHCSLKNTNSFYFLTPHTRYGTGGGWFYPVGKDSASMGYALLSRNAHSQGSTVKTNYLLAKNELQPYADWIKTADTERIEHGVIPIGRIGRFVDHRVLIVGDAAGHANPWCMMGINQSILNGQRCARIVLDSFAHDRFDRTYLYRYEREWAKANQEPFWRAVSLIEPLWIHQTDSGWDTFVSSYQRVPAQKQLRQLRYNEASFFERIYAVAGHTKRTMFSRLKNFITNTALTDRDYTHKNR